VISRFFIDRPIFAAVLSIFITLTGLIALLSLPIAQYPPITPPAVAVTINYPGASARVVADTVAAPIEQQVNGVEGMMYMSSQSSNDGSYSLDVTFQLGTDLNMAQVLVQNRVAPPHPPRRPQGAAGGGEEGPPPLPALRNPPPKRNPKKGKAVLRPPLPQQL